MQRLSHLDIKSVNHNIIVSTLSTEPAICFAPLATTVASVPSRLWVDPMP